MREKTLRDLKYLKQNYKPSEIQKLLNSSKLKREVMERTGLSTNYITLNLQNTKINVL